MAQGILSRPRAALVVVSLTALAISSCGKSGSAGSAISDVDAAGLQERVAAASGHPLLVAFWATWCKPCIEEMPDLVELHRESPRGLHVLAVSLDAFLSGSETRRVVTEYLQTSPAAVDHVIYQGSQDALFGAFELPGNIPYAILYGSDGRVLRRFSGRADPDTIRAVLAGGAARPST